MSKTNLVTIGIDLAKNTFHVVGLDARGAITLRKKRSRNQLGPVAGQCSALSDRRATAEFRVGAQVGPRDGTR